MATYSGSEGIIKIGSTQIAEVKSWSLEETTDCVDSSVIGTKWRKSQSTILGWSGTIDAFWDHEDEGQVQLAAGASVGLNLYPQGPENGRLIFSGTAIVTSVSRSASFDSLVEASFNFQGNGELHRRIVAE